VSPSSRMASLKSSNNIWSVAPDSKPRAKRTEGHWGLRKSFASNIVVLASCSRSRIKPCMPAASANVL
jgi:hypothetical protein